MKRIFYLAIFLVINDVAHSQIRLKDGIYLIDYSTDFRKAKSTANRTAITFNPYFVEEEPEAYDPLVICTDNFVPFELCKQPFIEKTSKWEHCLTIHLTNQITTVLKDFTSLNTLENVAVVIGGEAIAVYKIIETIDNGVIQIAKCNGSSCRLVARSLSKKFHDK